MNYTELKNAIVNYTHRDDLTAKLPTFIQLAEAHIFRELSLNEIEISVTSTTSGSTITLPADFGQVSRLTITYQGREMTIDSAINPDVSTTAGFPASYTLENNVLRLFPAPADAYSYTLFYIPAITGLSDTNTTNWLSINAPDLYLYAAALEYARDAKNLSEVQKLEPTVNTLLDSVRRHSERRGIARRGSLQIKPRRW